MNGKLLLGVPLLVLLAVVPAASQVQPPELGPSFEAARFVVAPPLRIAETAEAAPALSLATAAEGSADELAALTRWNLAGNLPLRVGFARRLAVSGKVDLAAAGAKAGKAVRRADGWIAASPAGSTVWGTSVQVQGADRLRLHLTGVELPAGTEMWVYGRDEEPQPFGLKLKGPDGGLWTPSVGGDRIYLEVEIPAGAEKSGAARFALGEVAQSFRLDRQGRPVVGDQAAERAGECLVDANCVTSATLDFIEDYRKAVALIRFVEEGSEFICSGGLLNDTVAGSFVPYFLTAHHCIGTQQVASTVEAFWDYKTSGCRGSIPDLSTLPRSNGAILLATSAGSDFTFLQLTGVPGGRLFLGWNAGAAAAPNGTRLHRISHPRGLPQAYSASTVRTSGVPFCSSLPRPNFLYSQGSQGGTFGGSSGSPVVLAGGYVVGQLGGGCGANPEDGCDYTNSEFDGAFSLTYPAIAQWLSPASGTLCIPGPTAMCLAGGRFKVEATWQLADGSSGPAQVVKLTDDSGYLWFFGSTNIEAVVKVIDACGVGGKFWVFAGGLTNVQTTLTVTDTEKNVTKTYANPQNTAFLPIQDTAAFATCP